MPHSTCSRGSLAVARFGKAWCDPLPHPLAQCDHHHGACAALERARCGGGSAMPRLALPAAGDRGGAARIPTPSSPALARRAGPLPLAVGRLRGVRAQAARGTACRLSNPINRSRASGLAGRAARGQRARLALGRGGRRGGARQPGHAALLLWGRHGWVPCLVLLFVVIVCVLLRGRHGWVRLPAGGPPCLRHLQATARCSRRSASGWAPWTWRPSPSARTSPGWPGDRGRAGAADITRAGGGAVGRGGRGMAGTADQSRVGGGAVGSRDRALAQARALGEPQWACRLERGWWRGRGQGEPWGHARVHALQPFSSASVCVCRAAPVAQVVHAAAARERGGGPAGGAGRACCREHRCVQRGGAGAPTQVTSRMCRPRRAHTCTVWAGKSSMRGVRAFPVCQASTPPPGASRMSPWTSRQQGAAASTASIHVLEPLHDCGPTPHGTATATPGLRRTPYPAPPPIHVLLCATASSNLLRQRSHMLRPPPPWQQHGSSRAHTLAACC
jgi:hypothetical protein